MIKEKQYNQIKLGHNIKEVCIYDVRKYIIKNNLYQNPGLIFIIREKLLNFPNLVFHLGNIFPI